MHEALLEHIEKAPNVWDVKPPDAIATGILNYKDYSVENRKRPGDWSPEASLGKAEYFASIAARGAIKQEAVNHEVLDQLSELKETVKDIRQQLTKSKRVKRVELPLRDPASDSVYDSLMNLKRIKHTSRYVWSRSRIGITLLRFLGLRASDSAAITLKEIQSALQHGSFQILQPKTGKYRVVILTKSAKKMLETLHLDIKTVFGEQFDKPLASAEKSKKQLSGAQWIRTLNKG